MTLQKAIAVRLNEILEEFKITPYRLSQLSGIAESSISDIRSQKCKTLSIPILYQLLDSIEMGLDEFFNSALFMRENITD